MEAGIADCSVGTIVWVRRRNGSWWPGRILGPEELSASHLMSPRSGTPVKLLGREDASVDWYNLEKSKRVKAFRCGEFDACIERAEASQGIPIKKREKYARREDAILHALELEKQQMELKHQKHGIVSNGISNKTSGTRRRELNSFPSSDNYTREDDSVHSKFANQKPQMFPRKASLSRDEEDDLYVHNGKTSKQAGWTEYNPETLPRTRGLQDFGLRAAPPKKKLPESTWETSYKPVNNHVSVLSDTGNMMGSANHAGGNKSSLAIKRKRPPAGSSEDSLVKKRDRRRPLVQVLQSTAKLPVPHSFHSAYDSGAISMHGERDNVGAICRAKRSRCVYLPADSNESLDDDGYPSEQMRDTESEFGTGDYLDHGGALPEEDTSSESDETESDSSESDESDTDDNTLTDNTQILLPGSKNCDPPAVHIRENFGDLNDDEKPHPGYMPQFHPEEQIMDVSADVGVSKWHMKGKRNIRNLPKRPMDPMDRRIPFSTADKCNGFVKETSYQRMGSRFKVRRTEPSSHRISGRGLYHKKEASHYAFDGVDMLERDGHNRLMPCGNQRYSFALQAAKDCGRSQNSFNDSDSDSHQLSPSLWEVDGPSPLMRRAYWEEADHYFNPLYADHLGDDMESRLINVELKVQAASYQGEHVPLVSLMSRLNGKAIIGHPVQIEILEDGSSGPLVTKYDADQEENAAPPAVWKTARRSTMLRIPRSHPVASAVEGEDAVDSDPESKPSPKKPYSGYFNHQARLAKKSISQVPGRFQKKLSKRVNLSNQKTRTLSSFATEQRLAGENGSRKLSRRSDILDGLIKADGAVPLVTCVPVKVVFSRILEAVGRPSSASAHRARMASPAIKDPS